MTNLNDNIANIEQQIVNACQQNQRNRADISLIAVSKTKPSNLLAQAYQLGQRQFAENYLQEALEKMAELAHLPDLVWHFIGPIQSNKTKTIAEQFCWVQSVDRAKIAHRLNEQRGSNRPPLNVCIQVNIDHEPTKAGVLPDDIGSLATIIEQCPHLTLRGLMAIPAVQTELTSYQQLLRLFIELQLRYPHVDTLSVGMSNDLTQAIANGSTMLRIGTAFFGHRV